MSEQFIKRNYQAKEDNDVLMQKENRHSENDSETREYRHRLAEHPDLLYEGEFGANSRHPHRDC